MNPNEPHPLAAIADRACRDAFFLGFALADYAHRHDLSLEELAERLACPADRLPQLCLCRLPDASDWKFADRVREIAAHIGCDETQLLLILRESAAMAALSGESPPTTESLFIAARDRRDKRE